ncbi:MAG: DUF1653 domain-containing protein [Patescibacteria group bacterium]
MLKIGGKYRHYKGNEYQIIAFAKHSETEEPLVIYQDLSDNEKIWARPRAMFEEEVEVEGKKMLRFTPIE